MTLQDYILERAPELGRQWHGQNDVSMASLTPGSHKKVWWHCDAGHRWQAPVYSVTGGTGCPYCSGKKPIPGETDLAAQCPDKAKLWDAKLNGGLRPEDVLPGSSKKVWWRCEKGHGWQAPVFSVAQLNSGCPYCAGKRAIPGETDLATVHPELMAQWHERNKLDPTEILPSAHNKAWWRCEKGHEWEAAVFSRTREKSAGCPYCSGKKVLPGFNDLATLKPGVAEEWYQPLNGELKPTEVSCGSNKKVWWQCPQRHVWQAAVFSRTRKKGSGCPVCTGTVKAPRQRYAPHAPIRINSNDSVRLLRETR